MHPMRKQFENQFNMNAVLEEARRLQQQRREQQRTKAANMRFARDVLVPDIAMLELDSDLVVEAIKSTASDYDADQQEVLTCVIEILESS